MARIRNGLISGRIGPIDYYVVNGVQFAKSHQPNVRRSENTIVAAKVFGVATALANEFRQSFAGVLLAYKKKRLTDRFTGALFSALNPLWREKSKTFVLKRNSFSALQGFEFDEKALVGNYIKVVPSIEFSRQVLRISLPKLEYNKNLLFPDPAMKCEVIVSVSLFRLKEGLRIPVAESQQVSVSQSTSSAATVFKFDVPKGCLAVATLFLNFLKTNPAVWRTMTTEEFNPGNIIAAVYQTGSFEGGDDRHWRNGTILR